MLRKLFRKTPLAWFQVRREKTRLAVAVAGIAFADVLMFVQLGFQNALYDSSVRLHYALQGELFLINPLSDNLQSFNSFPRVRLYQAARVEGVESISSIYIAQAKWRNPQTLASRTIQVLGFDPVKPTFNLPQVNQHLDELKMLNRALYDKAGRPGFGDVVSLLQKSNPLSVQIGNYDIQIIGIFTLGAAFGSDGNMITSDSTFLRMFPERQPNQIDVGIIHLQPSADIEQVQADLRASLQKDVMVLRQEEFAGREKAYWSTSTPIGFIFGFGTVIGFIVGTVIVYQILYSDVSDHLPEYATLKAIGYSNSYLIGVLIQESLILAILGFLPGLALSTGLYYLTQSATLLPIKMTLNRAILVLLLTIIMCNASGGIAMRKLQAADPADIF
jgi:DevC protein